MVEEEFLKEVVRFGRRIGMSAGGEGPARRGVVYFCQHCNYRCTAKQTLFGHFNIHHNFFPAVQRQSFPFIAGTHLYSCGLDFSSLWVPKSSGIGAGGGLINSIQYFLSTHPRSCARLTGTRKAIKLCGVGAETWRNGAKDEHLDFINAFQRTAYNIGRAHYGDEIEMSPNVLALVGAGTQQCPHVDLQPGQVQLVMTLSPAESISTKFYHHGTSSSTPSTSPTVQEAFAMLGIASESNSVYANVLRYAPALALPRATLLARLKSISLCQAQHTIPPGTFVMADHTVVHAGPCQKLKASQDPRIVLFTTFRYTQSVDLYSSNDQYMPPHFAEDPTMNSDRAIRLLQEWRLEKPQLSYTVAAQASACLTLSGSGALGFDSEKKKDLISQLRRRE